MLDPNMPPDVRVRVADLVFKHSSNLQLFEAFEQRLARMEKLCEEDEEKRRRDEETQGAPKAA